MINIIFNSLPNLNVTFWQKLLNLFFESIPVIISGSVVALLSGMLAERRTKKEKLHEKYIFNFGHYIQHTRNLLLEINNLYQKLLNLYVYMQKLNETGKEPSVPRTTSTNSTGIAIRSLQGLIS